MVFGLAAIGAGRMPGRPPCLAAGLARAVAVVPLPSLRGTFRRRLPLLRLPAHTRSAGMIAVATVVAGAALVTYAVRALLTGLGGVFGA